MSPVSITIAIIITLNVIAFLTMLYDKLRSSRTGAKRISEGKLFFMAAAFGSVGVYIGMFVCRHKTKKWYFLIGIPLIMLQNVALLSIVNSFYQLY